MDPYSVLGISRNASKDEIKSAYRKMVKKHHPDKGGSKEKFNEIQKAYDILNDNNKKSRYDSTGSTNSQGYDDGFGFDFNFNSGFDPNDIFDHIFGGGQRNSVGADVNIEISITLNDAYRGVSHNIEYNVNKECTTCSGKGYIKDSDISVCAYCKGRGHVQAGNSYMRVNMPCEHCKGRGAVIKNPCYKCNGSGIGKDKQNVSINIPAGIEDGSRLRVSGYGHASKGGRGDLYVLIHIESNNMFTRKKSDLYYTQTISCIDAMLGTTIHAPTILGEMIKIEIPSGTQPNTRITKHGYGMPITGSGKKGNMYVDIKVSIPININTKQKSIISKFKESSN